MAGLRTHATAQPEWLRRGQVQLSEYAQEGDLTDRMREFHRAGVDLPALGVADCCNAVVCGVSESGTNWMSISRAELPLLYTGLTNTQPLEQ